MIVDEHTRQPIGRPYLTVGIDVYSRCITGFCLTLEPPSAVSVGLCLAHAVLDKETDLRRLEIEGEWPIWGKPGTIHVAGC
jgi:putative transposase